MSHKQCYLLVNVTVYLSLNRVLFRWIGFIERDAVCSHVMQDETKLVPALKPIHINCFQSWWGNGELKRVRWRASSRERERRSERETLKRKCILQSMNFVWYNNPELVNVIHKMLSTYRNTIGYISWCKINTRWAGVALRLRQHCFACFVYWLMNISYLIYLLLTKNNCRRNELNAFHLCRLYFRHIVFKWRRTAT